MLPPALIALATRIRPLAPPDGTRGDASGGVRAATGLFGGHGLTPDKRPGERVGPGETAPVRLNLNVAVRRK